jgi:hypothetical protein
MGKPNENNCNAEDQADLPGAKPSRRRRLQALLFAGAALGTTLVTLGVLDIPKVPFGSGE